MTIAELLPLFEKYGIGGVLIFGVIYVLFTIFKNKLTLDGISTFITTKIFKSSKSNSSGRHISESDILNHDLFSFIDLWMYSKIPTITFHTEFRTVVFRKYLVLYLAKHKTEIFKYVQSTDYKEMDDSQLWQSILKLINDVIFEYEKDMILAGIPSVVIEKMKGRNNESVSLMIDLIEGICTSSFYDSSDNLLKVYSILNIILSILQSTIYGSEKTCTSINGQLKGQTFVKDGITYKEP